MNKTTIRLRLFLFDHWRIHERQIRDGAFVAAMVVALLLIHTLLRPAEPAPLVPVVMREVQRPAILIATATPAPPQPTATAIVEVREVYIAAPTLPPVVEYIEVPVYIASEPAPAAPQEPPAPVAPPPDAPQDGGGGGKMAAPDFGPIDSNAQWCAAAAAAGHAHCAGE